MAQRPKPSIPSLNSWKEISAFMDRGVRTIQRWEKELGLPVHRLGTGLRSPVHAYPSELTAWLLREHSKNSNDHNGTRLPSIAPNTPAMRTSAVARVLVHRSSGLVQQLVGSLCEQKKRTEKLSAALDEVQRRLEVLRSKSRKRRAS
jgi:hypothetical protein